MQVQIFIGCPLGQYQVPSGGVTYPGNISCTPCNTSLFDTNAIGCAAYNCSNAEDTVCIPATGFYFLNTPLPRQLPTGLCPLPAVLPNFSLCQDNILDCNATSSICYLCQPGYGSLGWVNGWNSSVCAPCIPGTNWNDGTQSGPCTNCLNNPAYCGAGYYQGSCYASASMAPLCYPCNNTIPHCRAVNCTSGSPADLKCTQCDLGTFLNTTTWKCDSCWPITGCAVENCTYLGDQHCLTCSPGYYLTLSTGGCSPCSTAGVIGCATTPTCTTSRDQTCSACSSYYYLSAGYCYVCSNIQFCATELCTSNMDATATCTSCQSGYRLSYNRCVSIPPHIPPPCPKSGCV